MTPSFAFSPTKTKIKKTTNVSVDEPTQIHFLVFKSVESCGTRSEPAIKPNEKLITVVPFFLYKNLEYFGIHC